MDAAHDAVVAGLCCLGVKFVTRKKERKKSLTRGHVKDIGSAVGMQSYRGNLLQVFSFIMCLRIYAFVGGVCLC